jgi:hypothetical protein
MENLTDKDLDLELKERMEQLPEGSTFRDFFEILNDLNQKAKDNGLTSTGL